MMNWKSLLVATLVGTGCQTYDFEPVQPLSISQTTQTKVIEARGQRPELMILLDKSGSMDLPINPSDPDCILPNGLICGRKGEADSAPCNTTICPTRWSSMQGAMGSFIPNTANLARMGFAAYPFPNSELTIPGCFEPSTPLDGSGNPDGVIVPLTQSKDVPAELQGQANLVLGAIQRIKSDNPPGPNGTGGGTPTGPALRMLKNYTDLTTSTRARLILLLTDGLPNCNPSNVNDYGVNPAACECPLDAMRCQALTDQGFGKDACLDQTDTVAAVTQLYALGVKTIVVGFGAETAAPSALATLNGMATAGGFARACPNGTNAECGAGDTCTVATHICSHAYYQAGNATELQNALAQISAIVLPSPCTYDLDARPDSTDFLLVTFEGQDLLPSPSTWELDSQGRVEFFGTYCDQLKASNAGDQVNVSFRIVQQL